MRSLFTLFLVVCLSIYSSMLFAQTTEILIGGEDTELSPEGVISGNGCFEWGGLGAAVLDEFNIYYQPLGEGDFVDNLFPDPEVYSFQMNIPDGLPNYQSQGRHGSFWDSDGREGEGVLPWINRNWRGGEFYNAQYRPTGEESPYGVVSDTVQWNIDYWDAVQDSNGIHICFIHTCLTGMVEDFYYDEDIGNATALLRILNTVYLGYGDDGEPGPGAVEYDGGTYQGFDSFRERSGLLDYPAFFFQYDGEDNTGSLTPCGTMVKLIGEDELVKGYFDVIQEAIDASEDGDTVLVSPGEYVENINFEGKAIAIIGNPDDPSEVIIDGDENGRVVTLEDIEGDGVVLTGFTITNGLTDESGGGIYCYRSNPTITFCIITNNQAEESGGGVYCLDDVIFNNCYITNNISGSVGGGVWCRDPANVEFNYCTINENTSGRGGGIATYNTATIIINFSEIRGNTSEQYAAAIRLDTRSRMEMRNCTVIGNNTNQHREEGAINLFVNTQAVIMNSIIRQNEDVQISCYNETGSVSLAYNNIQGGQDDIVNGDIDWGDGNIDEDPLFVDPDEGDYHLTEDSPCIDTGDPDSPEDPDETRADMGAYYFHQRRDAETLLVPQDYETIQEAINASEDGDTVLVSPGTYVENINFEGKGITVASLILTTGDRAYIDSTIIDGNEESCVVSFNNEEDSTSVLQGFTIRNGIQDFGGGIDCQRNTSPVLLDLIITENVARSGGGGIYFTRLAEPIIKRTVIIGNSGWRGGGIGSWLPAHAYLEDVVITGNTSSFGGGLYGESNGSYTLENVLIYGNTATSGGGVYLFGSTENVFNRVTITSNQAENSGGIGLTTGEENTGGSSLNIVNSIVWGNAGTQITHAKNSDSEFPLNISFCDIEGGDDGIQLSGGAELNWGDGNIVEDPLFVDPDEGDYRLTEDSPCIDTGDPDSPEDPDGTRADMGAYYFYQNHVINVPDDFETIQEAIDASRDGDRVLVSPGEYVENIDFIGKNIIVASLLFSTLNEAYIDSTVIDGDSSGAVVTFDNEEGEETYLLGFTIRNGYVERNGGGIRCVNSSPTIANCKIHSNHVGTRGGGISCEPNANPVISGCDIFENTSNSGGAGIWCGENSSPTISGCHIYSNEAGWNGAGLNMYIDCDPIIDNCIFEENVAHHKGGAIIVSQDCSPLIVNCQILDNMSVDNGGGITVERNATPLIRNCLLEDNLTEDDNGGAIAAIENASPIIVNCTFDWEAIYGWYTAIYLADASARVVNSIVYGPSPLWIRFDPDSAESSIMIAYSDIQDGQESIVTNNNGEVHWEDGNIDAEPQFVDREEGDYNLSEDSPCIDAGTAFLVWDGDTLVNMSVDEYDHEAPDMGAHESEYSGVDEDNAGIPTEFALYQNYPNPFNSATSLSFDLPVSGNVTLAIYDINGREIAVIADDTYNAGAYTAVWDAQNLPSGIYIARLEAADVSRVVKLMLIR
ncbi:MAG: right-handed parallel beta-helix repeat-containing protein [Calditrichaeota bacterium]|nr:right-handed parallel beta-helix repeat-containing protein [Calditrichota bacterium]